MNKLGFRPGASGHIKVVPDELRTRLDVIDRQIEALQESQCKVCNISRKAAADIAKATGGDPDVWDRLFGVKS